MSEAIAFILNGQHWRVGDVSPTATVLDWLRADAGLLGTKEGCAEGDCGACTVVVGEADGGAMRWRAVNACLMALTQLDGTYVLTVEGLADDGGLHPVQRALVEADASQCGFCTPGFVMALFAWHHTGEPAEPDNVHDALAGNLCRCTGYRPIVDAALAVGSAAADRFAAREAEIAFEIKGLRGGSAAFAADGQRYFAPTTLDDLVALRAAHPDAWILAGGTDLGLRYGKEGERPETVISVARVAELQRIARTATHVEIGAAVTYTQALPLIEDAYPAMAALIRRIGSRQIRNLGTIGGNIANASPIGDTPPCLIALDSILVLRSGDGVREMPIEDYFVGYRETALALGEVIEAVRIPLLADDQVFHAYKVSKRFDQDISAVIGAYRLTLAGGVVREARTAYGGMAATPKRAAACEAALIGQPWTAETARAVGAALGRDFQPISDFRAGSGYRAKVAANLLQRLHLQTTGAAHAVEVAEL